MAHLIYSDIEGAPIQWFDTFDKQAIKDAIIKRLREHPADSLEHCKEYSKVDQRKYAGYEIINFYEMHKGRPCKVTTTGKFISLN